MKKSIYKFAILSLLSNLLINCSSEKEITKILPQLSTTSATAITLTSATSGGNITADGGATVTARGIVWNTATAPTISLASKSTDGSGIGDFTSTITNLSPSTNYFARAYATNSVGTGYGNEITFTTGAVVLPTLTTTMVSGITTNSAISGGTITNDGGGAVTARGIVWSTTQNPTTILTTKTNDGINTGTYTSNLTNLSPNTTYYIRSYASNSIGTSYGSEISFKTNIDYTLMYPTGTVFCNNLATAVVDVTSTSGKTWMDRNLGASQVANSSTDALAYGDAYQWGRRADGHQCRNSRTSTVLSSVYQPNHGDFILVPITNFPRNWLISQSIDLWDRLSGVNNPCPLGYRIPTETELNVERSWWAYNGGNNKNGAFSSPLKLSAGGVRSFLDGSFADVDNYGFYWSSTLSANGSRYLHFGNTNSYIAENNRSSGLSVRCIKN